MIYAIVGFIDIAADAPVCTRLTVEQCAEKCDGVCGARGTIHCSDKQGFLGVSEILCKFVENILDMLPAVIFVYNFIFGVIQEIEVFVLLGIIILVLVVKFHAAAVVFGYDALENYGLTPVDTIKFFR